jgi:hypothetical protein
MVDNIETCNNTWPWRIASRIQSRAHHHYHYVYECLSVNLQESKLTGGFCNLALPFKNELVDSSLRHPEKSWVVTWKPYGGTERLLSGLIKSIHYEIAVLHGET